MELIYFSRFSPFFCFPPLCHAHQDRQSCDIQIKQGEPILKNTSYKTRQDLLNIRHDRNVFTPIRRFKYLVYIRTEWWQ